MSLREKINNQYNSALKSKDKTLVSTLRLVLAAIKDKDIINRMSEKKQDAKDEEILKILQKMKKQREDSADMYKKGNRTDLLKIEVLEIKIIESFLPTQLNEAETRKICEEVIKNLGVSSIKDIGKIMGSLKQKYSSLIDFSKVNIIIKDLLK
jgi:uncharacterized protein YqeY